MNATFLTFFVTSRDVDADQLTEWFRSTVQHPVALQSRSNKAFVLISESEYVGAQGQSAADLHACALLWLVAMNLAPSGIDILWNNTWVDSVGHTNTQELEFLMQSPTATAWFLNTVRPNLLKKFGAHF